MDGSERFVHHLVFEVVFLVLASPLWMGGIYLAQHVDAIVLQVLGGVAAALALVTSLYLTSHATHRRMSGESFGDSVSGAFADLRIALSFLPVIGKYLAPRDRS
jgi:hypothetical protein